MGTTIPDVTHYTYRVNWSADDQEFVATCLELPSLSWLAPTQDEAMHGLAIWRAPSSTTCTATVSRSHSHCHLAPIQASSISAWVNGSTVNSPSRRPKST